MRFVRSRGRATGEAVLTRPQSYKRADMTQNSLGADGEFGIVVPRPQTYQQGCSSFWPTRGSRIPRGRARAESHGGLVAAGTAGETLEKNDPGQVRANPTAAAGHDRASVPFSESGSAAIVADHELRQAAGLRASRPGAATGAARRQGLNSARSATRHGYLRRLW